jgi:putative DNA methylase
VRAVRFEVRTGAGTPPEPPKVGRGATFRCLVCGQIAEDQHIKNEGLAGRMGQQLMAIVAEGQRGRVYLSPTPEHEAIAAQAQPTQGVLTQPLANDPRNIWCVNYGLTTFDKLFTPRQLVALTTFSDLVSEAREHVLHDAQRAGMTQAQAAAYADAVATYLALAVDRLVDRSSSICSWDSGYVKVRNTFARQAIPMTWDFAEANPFSESTGNFGGAIEWITKVLGELESVILGTAKQLNATAAINGVRHPLISTDPPYYDNIGYADLSDFFYVWLRRSLGAIYPDLFSTLLVPKAQELVATPYRFGGDKERARRFFEEGLGKAFAQMRRAAHPDYPLTVYYAFKQAESDEEALTPDPSPKLGEGGGGSDGVRAVASTGWETMLEGLMRAGFQITGTWPMRSELGNRMIASGTNALASSIVLVCRPRPEDAPVATRREFINALRRELPEALRQLQHGNIAPVDLAQAAIGPGMAIFSRYRRVVESDGSAMRVRTALQLINAALDEVLAEQEGEYDNDTRWAIAWFDQYGMAEGPFGVAETLSKAKNTSIGGLVEAGILQARGGKVRLLRRDELPADWDPTRDRRVSVWEVTQHLIRALEQRGENGAAEVLRQVGALGNTARDLAYRLYTTCERKKWSNQALAYNSLVVAWPSIVAQMLAQPGMVGQERWEL